MKNIIFAVILLLFLVPIIGMTYYILVNTALKDVPLKEISVTDLNVSANQNNKLVIKFENESYEIDVNRLEIRLNSQMVANYGKGADITKVLQEGINLLNSNKDVVSNKFYTINFDELFSGLALKPSDKQGAHIMQNSLLGCNSGIIQTNLDDVKLTEKVLESIQNNIVLNITTADLGLTTDQQNIVALCKKYFQYQDYFRTILKDESVNLEDFVTAEITADADIRFVLINQSKLDEILTLSRFRDYVEPYNGQYEELDSVILLFDQYKMGKDLDSKNSLAAIATWLDNPSQNLNLIYTELKPAILLSNKRIVDFSQKISAGSTRMQQIIDGYENPGIYFAELGLDEIHNTIIEPGEEFSFLKKIAKQPGLNLTSSGRLIGYGYCNSTTTLFRAVLEAGLPVTDRSYHWFNVPSYEWGYPLNLVDAAFFATPGLEVDLKFKNDYEYPILIRSVKRTEPDGFQYHTVHMYSSALAKKRTVELYDWQKTAVYSPTKFDGLFKRKVYQEDTLIREDEFFSMYR